MKKDIENINCVVEHNADDEEPNCFNCDNLDKEPSWCINHCGANRCWREYRRTVIGGKD